MVLGFANNTRVATALTCTPSYGSQISLDLPRPGQIGNIVGGVTCIYIHRKSFLNSLETCELSQRPSTRR
ncbi:hypothetical protein DL98DRAFT_437937 [Cadophora sp. DSE1049]|nr:hypothetical protein DL98DRAFT_437937 [Cadophora sp. DSE1049]